MNEGAIDAALRHAVEAADVVGVVAAVADRNGVQYLGAHGERRAGTGEAMTPDAVFRIASLTKPVTSVAALQLVDRGVLDLDTPVAEVIPAWAELPVLEGFDGDRPRLREQRTTATVRHLLSHTAGLSYFIWNADSTRYEAITGVPSVLSGSLRCFDTPLVRDAGERWEYSMATDWVGRVVEEVSGQRLDAYFSEHIFGPLAMHDTTTTLDDGARQRLVPVHVRTADGALAPIDMPENPAREFVPGGHCLYSTVDDYQRFARMLLRNGELDGVRLLREDIVGEMFTNQIGELDVEPLPEEHPQLSAAVDFGPGLKFGLGVMLNPAPWPQRRAAGSGTWAGLYNCHFWVDRATGIAASILTQFLPFWDPGGRAVYEDFERAVYRT